MTKPRITGPTLQVLGAFLENPTRPLAGSDIRSLTKVGPGTLYPILVRLEGAGWLESAWEELSPEELGRPRKRFYTLTKEGASHARAAFDLTLSNVKGGLAWV